ncbi:FAD-binding oxidoreductase [Luteimonas sp. 8-5]|uniref:FAD-binding oxidoreductase n=1 Tax=Luteimonas sp. 8-5 TaxID=3039387 RepID=UPI002436C3F0|nr:FAD-binding oxidoreductase [Luteimonas sp. 8-5]MDG6348303.1 FAD-binding oxidoreductase [Luteimonas sp. 8-5]
MRSNEAARSKPACVVVDAPEALARYASDWTNEYAGQPSMVALPATVPEVVELVQWARREHVGLVPSGGRTGLSGGAVASNGEAVVSFERMRRLIAFDATERSLRVEAGAVTQAVQERARAEGLFYPVDFASRGSSQIGGNIATNAGGIKVLRYGLTRNWVTALKVVTGTGELLDLNKGLIKNATGYDLRHLFIGSEGTLGLVVEATLQLTDPPPPQQVMVLGLPSLAAIMEVFARLRGKLTLSAFEFFTEQALTRVIHAGGRRPFDTHAPYYVLAEFDEDEAMAGQVFEACHGEGLVEDGAISQSGAQAMELWRLREGITESLSRYRPYKNDIAVRVAQVPAFLERIDALFEREYPGFEVIWFGHIGDGNLHISVLPPHGMPEDIFLEACGHVTDQLGRVLAEFGGSISAEHGVGLLKKPYLHYSRNVGEIELMRQLKRVFDPTGILNPGKIFDP